MQTTAYHAHFEFSDAAHQQCEQDGHHFIDQSPSNISPLSDCKIDLAYEDCSVFRNVTEDSKNNPGTKKMGQR